MTRHNILFTKTQAGNGHDMIIIAQIYIAIIFVVSTLHDAVRSVSDDKDILF